MKNTFFFKKWRKNVMSVYLKLEASLNMATETTAIALRSFQLVRAEKIRQYQKRI